MSQEAGFVHDAIIVGARCAGSAIAMLLSRRGYRVLLIDRQAFPSDMTMSTHFIHQRGICQPARNSDQASASKFDQGGTVV